MAKKATNSLKGSIESGALPDGHKDVLAFIIAKIKAAQVKALKAVNQELIEVYRDIGKTIHDKQEKLCTGQKNSLMKTTR